MDARHSMCVCFPNPFSVCFPSGSICRRATLCILISLHFGDAKSEALYSFADVLQLHWYSFVAHSCRACRRRRRQQQQQRRRRQQQQQPCDEIILGVLYMPIHNTQDTSHLVPSIHISPAPSPPVQRPRPSVPSPRFPAKKTAAFPFFTHGTGTRAMPPTSTVLRQPSPRFPAAKALWCCRR